MRRGTSDIVHCAIPSISGCTSTTDGSLDEFRRAGDGAHHAHVLPLRVQSHHDDAGRAERAGGRDRHVVDHPAVGEQLAPPPHGRKQAGNGDRRPQREAERTGVDDHASSRAQIGGEGRESSRQLLDERDPRRECARRRRRWRSYRAGPIAEPATSGRSRPSGSRGQPGREPPARRLRRRRRPTRAPELVPVTMPGRMPRSARTCRTPTCAAPKAPPPPRTSPRSGSSPTWSSARRAQPS